MFSFIYYYMFKILEKRNPDPMFGAASFIFFLQLIFVFFILSTVKFILKLDYSMFRFSETYTTNKLLVMPFLLVWLVCVYYHFKRKHSNIKKRYKSSNIVNVNNGIFIILILFTPLLLGISFLKT